MTRFHLTTKGARALALLLNNEATAEQLVRLAENIEQSNNDNAYAWVELSPLLRARISKSVEVA